MTINPWVDCVIEKGFIYMDEEAYYDKQGDPWYKQADPSA